MAKKAPAKKPAKKQATATIQQIKLDKTEAKAIDQVQDSAELCRDLESAVSAAAAEAVRKVYKKHGLNLTAAQAGTVTMILFGDEG